MQDITEQQDVAQEINDAISRPFGETFDEVDTFLTPQPNQLKCIYFLSAPSTTILCYLCLSETVQVSELQLNTPILCTVCVFLG